MTKLVTFGCSWTWGVGAYWTPHCSNDYDSHWENAWTLESEDNAARSIISRKFNLENVNFSKGGRSNYYNFRNLREFIVSNTDTDIIILFGVTSTSRNEVYDVEHEKYTAVKFDDGSESLENEFFLKHYSHENEVKILEEQMLIWNDLLNSYNIPIIWYDTFNTHNYSQTIDNLLSSNILTSMLESKNVPYKSGKKWYHMSSWQDDDPRITAGVKSELLNPVSFHPSKYGQEVIAGILDPYIKERL